MSNSREFMSKTKAIVTTFDGIGENFNGLQKKMDESATVLDMYTTKTNIPTFSEVAEILRTHSENTIKDIKKLIGTTTEAAMEAHKQFSDVATSGLNI